MATAPYKINDRRSSSGYVYTGSSNTLIESARPNTDRWRAPNVDKDFNRTLSAYGRRTLMRMGRHLFWKFPVLQGLVLEQANVAVSTFLPQYTGPNKEWGRMAEAMLNEWHKVMDIAGWPYDYDTYVQQLVIAPLIDGENFTLLTETGDGYPMIQVIPSHRVGGRAAGMLAEEVTVRFYQETLSIDGVVIDDSRPYLAEDAIEFQAALIDGVIQDPYGRAIAYRTYADPLSEEFQDIPARNFFPAFLPMMTGQGRGPSILASSLFNWEDIHEWKRWEMLAHKTFSGKTIMETTESGEMDPAKAMILRDATFDATTGAKETPTIQQIDGGAYTYLKANAGTKLEPFLYNRPGPDSQKFIATELRDAFRGTEWDVFFGLDPQAVGGAPMRVIVEKINLVAAKRRKLTKKCCMRVDGYALAKFMKLGLLPFDESWWQWDYQGPGDITADRKYDSDVDLQEIAQGIGTRKNACARRGEQLEDVDAQRESEVDSDLTRATRLSNKHGITVMEAMVLLRPPTPNQQLPQQQQQEQKPANGE
jgi:hypothetical protein